jgi:glycosyltransferase involved in cell wall biosynthesis
MTGTLAGRVLVVIPAYNEEESLARTVQEVRLKAPGLDLLVVDDGSRDGTVEVARRLGVPFVSLPVNLGVGGALQTGFRYAVGHGYEVGVQLDADGQHDPAYLEALLAPVLAARADVSIGSRYVTGSSSYRAPLARRFGMLFFSWVVRLAVGQRIADTTSGFRAYNSAVMRACLHDFPKDFPDAPLLIRLARGGFRLVEVPVEMRSREAGRSFYTLTKSLYYPYKCLVASIMAVLSRRS